MAKRILVVEDEPLGRKQIALFLRQQGYEVNEANDGVEALDLIDTSHFDLVLSDVRMPRVDGMAVVLHLRSISPNVPFIILTAYPDDAVAIAGMPRALLMSKPVMLADLQSKIRVLLQQW